MPLFLFCNLLLVHVHSLHPPSNQLLFLFLFLPPLLVSLTDLLLLFVIVFEFSLTVFLFLSKESLSLGAKSFFTLVHILLLELFFCFDVDFVEGRGRWDFRLSGCEGGEGLGG